MASVVLEPSWIGMFEKAKAFCNEKDMLTSSGKNNLAKNDEKRNEKSVFLDINNR
uniref:Uncharacterized protein n=1 Tax=Chroomonas placoidea TaxID=173977 RepID=A0A2P1G824_9CRYP|nr:hypothetical protein CplaMt_p023 [Chroomonas placoidea]AVM81102.1 hypothetical protein CplaMt_p023 [Chroomonas placoidea]